MIELLVFDCDGTLLQTVDAKTRAFEQVGSLISPEAGAALAAWHRANGGVNRTEKFAWLYRNFLGREITPEETRKLCDLFEDCGLSNIHASEPVPGVLKALEAWQGKIPMRVASGAPQKELEQLLRAKGLHRYFDAIHGYPPGKREQLRTAIRGAGASAYTTVMTGDSQSDLDAAMFLDARFYGIGEGMRSCGQPWHYDFSNFNAWLGGLL